MIVVIDTSSLLSLVRYYLPFDNQGRLFGYFKHKISANEIIILDKVYEESKNVAQGIIVNKLNFLKDKNLIVKTDGLLPDQKYFNRLENEFCYGSMKNILTHPEFESRKNEFLNSADSKLLLYCLQNKDKISPKKLVIVTEETERSNDTKTFKKLPAICEILQIEHSTLPELIKTFNDLNISFNNSIKK